MIQVLDKYGNTNNDEGRVLVFDKDGNIKRLGGGGGSGTVTSIATTSPITGGTITTTGTIGISQATTSTDGYLSSTDWNTFNNKWSLTGNSGTTAGTNFIGTTDAQNLVFKTNNTQRISIDTGHLINIYGSLTSNSNELGDTINIYSSSGYGAAGIGFGNTAGGVIYISKDATHTCEIYAQNLTTATYRTLQVPDASGTIPLSVNGNTANTSGAITIPIGTGTVTSVGAGTGMSFTAITTSGNVAIDTAKVPYYTSAPSNGLLNYTSGTWGVDTNTYLTSAITSLGGLTGATQTFGNDTNVTMVSSGTTHTLTWSGTLADSRIASASVWNDKVTSLTAGTGISIGGTTTVPIITNTAPYTGVPTLNQVLTAGNTSTQSIAITNGTGISVTNGSQTSYQQPNQFLLKGITYQGSLSSATLFSNQIWTFPNNTGTVALTSDIPTVGTWGALNYPTWTSGTPFVKMTAAGTFSLDTNTYLTSAVTSVGLSMPSAFTVASSPVTGIGTIAVTGAGLVSQYIRGDGTLANFPISTGGGSSVSYYLNGSVNQGVFSGNTYYEINGTPVIGAGTDFTINADGYIAQFITDVADPNKLLIPAGNWNFETYFSASSSGGTPSFYIELYKYDGATFTLIASNSATPENITGGTAIDLYFTAIAVPSTVLLATDRLAVRFYVTHSGRTIKMHTEDSHLSQIITTFSTGLTALNGLTAQVQSFANDTNVTMVSSGSTHTITWAGTLADARIASAITWNAKQNTRSVNVVSIATAAGSAASTDYVYLVSGTTTITLPTAVGNTNRYTIKNTGNNVVSIATTSSQTIDGSASPITINTQYVSLDLISDGSNWYII